MHPLYRGHNNSQAVLTHLRADTHCTERSGGTSKRPNWSCMNERRNSGFKRNESSFMRGDKFYITFTHAHHRLPKANVLQEMASRQIRVGMATKQTSFTKVSFSGNMFPEEGRPGENVLRAVNTPTPLWDTFGCLALRKKVNVIEISRKVPSLCCPRFPQSIRHRRCSESITPNAIVVRTCLFTISGMSRKASLRKHLRRKSC